MYSIECSNDGITICKEIKVTKNTLYPFYKIFKNKYKIIQIRFYDKNSIDNMKLLKYNRYMILNNTMEKN